MEGKHAWLAVAVAVLAVAAGDGFSAPDTAFATKATAKAAAKAARREAAKRREARHLLRQIGARQQETWHWQRLMGARPTPHSDSGARSIGLGYRRWVLHLWAVRARQARWRAQHPPHLRGWLCIHRYEGDWRDPGPPYYGGLQMDLEFQRTYGASFLRRKGTAEHWTPLEQMWVAERAYQSGRGFYAWPNTARYCGLI
jgi:hypothetical protein